jgi:hypothetical protein
MKRFPLARFAKITEYGEVKEKILKAAISEARLGLDEGGIRIGSVIQEKPELWNEDIRV